ncbi:myosin head family protein [Cryptosporidium felis]|nr:myosin head family protein [Cryptosporidium felis]
MEQYNEEIEKGSKVWVYSRANASTMELASGLAEIRGATFTDDTSECGPRAAGEGSLDAFILATVRSYDRKLDMYECDYAGEFRKELEKKVATSILVSKGSVYKADMEFGYKDNSQLRNLNIGNVLKNIQVCYEMLKSGLNEVKDECISNPVKQGRDFPKYPMYSFAGGILIAVNPYKDYDIYNEEIVQEFFGRNIVNMEPHPFAIAEWTYRRMLKDRRSQSIVISGESGAGKTETSKHVLKYLSHMSNKQRRREVREAEGERLLSSSSIEDCLLSSNPLLEVFGNSRTIRNDNSSRFGKYMKLGFNESGKIVNACINTYLLAKSRVVHLPRNERNYHIFYHILNDLTDDRRRRWGLDGKEDSLEYNYLKTFDSSGESISNFQVLSEVIKTVPYDLKLISDCFHSIGVSEEFQEQIYDLVYSILLLGNVEFKSTEDSEECEITADSMPIIGRIVELWNGGFGEGMFDEKLTCEDLVELLTTKNIVKIKKRLSYSEAIYTRDSISRYLYEWIFNLTVELINIALRQTIFDDSSNIERDSDRSTYIGILDIFGFEDLEPNHANSFEQLLINYCNEKLHSFFLEQLLYRDTVLYKTEGIHNNISMTPSANVMELLFQQSFVCTLMSGINPKYLNISDGDCSSSKGESENPFFEKIKYNNSILNLLPYNIVSILDESGKIPIKGNRDHAFCNKVHLLNKLSSSTRNARTSVNRGSICGATSNREENNSTGVSQLNDLANSIAKVIQIQKLNLEKTFTINHFAGPVKYTSDEFISKNTDFLSSNIEKVIHSRINTVRRITHFKLKLLNNIENSEIVVDGEILNSSESISCNLMDKNTCLQREPNNKEQNLKLGSLVLSSSVNTNQVSTPMSTNKNKSVSSMFVKQVQNMLLNELYPTQSHFIRCIKPNNSQKSLVFNGEKVFKQLQIGGIIQILNIMIYGYPCRIPYNQIYKHFKQIIEIDQGSHDDTRTLSKAKMLLGNERLFVSLLLGYMGFKDKIDYQLGLTRVFFKFNVLDKVELFIQRCDQENSIDWKIECINSLYEHWIRKKCSNYWNMIKCSYKLLVLLRYVRMKNACRVIYKALSAWIKLKKEKILREEMERIEREIREREENERKEREEMERIEREIREREREREREEKERKEREEMERIEREIREREREEKERKEREEMERIEREIREREREREREEKERKEREEMERIEREIREREREEKERKEREEMERIEREIREREENERKEREEMERIEREIREREENERKEREEMERIEREIREREEKERKEREEGEKTEDKINMENKEVGEGPTSLDVVEGNDAINVSPKQRKTKRNREEFTQDYESETIYLGDYLRISHRKKVKANEVIHASEPMDVEEVKTNAIEDEESETNSNYSPLLCTSTMRKQEKRYSMYYISGNETTSENTEVKSLQDELVEAEFIDDVLNGEADLANDENHEFNNIKTGIKRPTVFIPNTSSNSTNDYRQSSKKSDEAFLIQQSSDIEHDSSRKTIKKSLKDIQENFRNNIIKQKKP